MPVCGSGGLVCSSCLLIRRAQRARCQAETPPILLSRFPEPALPCTLQKTMKEKRSALVGYRTGGTSVPKYETGAGSDQAWFVHKTADPIRGAPSGGKH